MTCRLSLDHESAPVCPWPQPRQPDALMGRRPRPLYLADRGASGAAARGGSGDVNEIGATPSPEYGLGAEAPSQRPPDPRRTAAPEEGGHRLTTRPRREPCLTGLSLGGDEPAAFRMAAEPGNERVSGPAGACSPAQPPCSAERGRRSPHECWVRLVLGPRGQESRPPADRQAGSPTDVLRRRCRDPGEKASRETPKSPWPWKIFSLDSENLPHERSGGEEERHLAFRDEFLVGFDALPFPVIATGVAPSEVRWSWAYRRAAVAPVKLQQDRRRRRLDRRSVFADQLKT